MFNKISRWLKYNPPDYLTSKGWRLFEKEFAERAPIRYKIKLINRDFRLLRSRLHKPFEYLRLKFIERRHIVDTGLRPGLYEFDTQILHGAFNEFSKFMEYSYIHCFLDYKENWKRRLPFVKDRDRGERRKLLIKLYQEQIGILNNPLVDEEEKNEARQSLRLLRLYHWWNVERPSRIDRSVTYDNQGFKRGSRDPRFNQKAPDFQAYKKYIIETVDKRAIHDEEDTDMLVSLVKIRQDIWV